MNPETNELEKLAIQLKDAYTGKATDLINDAIGEVLIRPNGEPIPKHWSIFKVNEEVVIKNYTFKVAYINESTLVLEPVRPVLLNPDPDGTVKLSK